MADGKKQNFNPIQWREIAIKAYLYTIFLLMIYALFVGFKMSQMLSQGQEIDSFLKAAHVHTLTESILLLLVIYDFRQKRVESLKVSRGEELIGIGVAGLILVATGFSVAALIPVLAAKGIYLMHIGQTLFFFSLFGYAVSAIIGEVYK